MALRVWAPGRVNLIGDHTDYTGGLCLPFALPLGLTFDVEPSSGRVELSSDGEAEAAIFDVPVRHLDSVQPQWARYVAAMADQRGAAVGLRGHIRSSLPLGAGLSSSAALCIGVGAAFDTFNGSGTAGDAGELDRRGLALAAQAAELTAAGVPCGLLDQLAILKGEHDALTRIDCRSVTTSSVPFSVDADIWIVHSGVSRTLHGSEYADRRAQCEAAEVVVGPLRDATLDSLDALEDHPDQTLYRRARHVVTENARVEAMVEALGGGDARMAGDLLIAGHRSLAADFETSTPEVDALLDALIATPGVYGARMTGGGFGGCVVVLCEPGVDPTRNGLASWRVRPSVGLWVNEVD